MDWQEIPGDEATVTAFLLLFSIGVPIFALVWGWREWRAHLTRPATSQAEYGFRPQTAETMTFTDFLTSPRYSYNFQREENNHEACLVWVGPIPDNCALADELTQFGEIVSTSVRRNQAEQQSWALATFADRLAARAAIKQGEILVIDDAGQKVTLEITAAPSSSEWALLRKKVGPKRKLSRSPSAREDWELAMEEKTLTTPKRNPARSLAAWS